MIFAPKGSSLSVHLFAKNYCALGRYYHELGIILTEAGQYVSDAFF